MIYTVDKIDYLLFDYIVTEDNIKVITSRIDLFKGILQSTYNVSLGLWGKRNLRGLRILIPVSLAFEFSNLFIIK